MSKEMVKCLCIVFLFLLEEKCKRYPERLLITVHTYILLVKVHYSGLSTSDEVVHHYALAGVLSNALRKTSYLQMMPSKGIPKRLVL